MSIHETVLVVCDENKDKHECDTTRVKKLRWRDETIRPSSHLVDETMTGHESTIQMTREEHLNTWYPSHELVAQRQLAFNVAAGIRQGEASSGGNSYGGVMERVYNSCLPDSARGPSKDDLRMLEHWTRVAHSRRGLERWSIPASGERRAEARKVLVQEIVRLQQRIDPHLDSDEKAEKIRSRSRSLSRASRRYATIMGLADAKAFAVQTRCHSI